MTQSVQKNITLGTAGHIDHGKTALIKLLTGCDTDHLKAEKERGMSIELGFAPCRLADLEVGIVDVPGHENFIKTMVAGATGVDATLFVVAADDGVMPQTEEHLDILRLLGVHEGLVALTKIDLVSAERLQDVQDELAVFLEGTFLEQAPVLPLSSVTGEGFDAFYEALKDLVTHVTPKATDGVFRLPVERTFSIKGYGTVVSGIPVSGQAKTGDELVLLPQGIRGRLKTLQVYQHTAASVKCGQCAALNVPQWGGASVSRGDVVTQRGYFSPSSWYLCELNTLNFGNLNLKNGSDVKFHTGTSESMAALYLLAGNRLPSGCSQLVQVQLAQPLVAGPQDAFILRTHAPSRTIGGGMIVEALERKLRRSRPEVLADAAARAAAVKDSLRFLDYCIRYAPEGAATSQALCTRCKLTPAQIDPLLQRLQAQDRIVVTEGQRYTHRDTLDHLGGTLLQAIEQHHREEPGSPGLDPERGQQICALSRDLFAILCQHLQDRNLLARTKGRLAHPEHGVQHDPALRTLIDRMEPFFLQALFQPPKLPDLATQLGAPLPELTRQVRLLAENEILVRVDRDMYFHVNAVNRACQLATQHIREHGKLESVQFKYLLDTTRKYALPLLDYLDKLAVTRRNRDNTRTLGPAAPEAKA